MQSINAIALKMVKVSKLLQRKLIPYKSMIGLGAFRKIKYDINGSGNNMYTADNICKITEFFIDNIFAQFGGRLFRQLIGIPMRTNCAPLLAEFFLYSYENEFLDIMIKSGHRRLARSFNLCYRLC